MIVSHPLDEIWPVILPKITAIRERYDEVCDWTEDDIYRACSENRAFIFCNTEDESFAIVKMKQKPVPTLFIWIAYGKSGKRDRNIKFLREIARNAGASRMEMESPRLGFDRMPGWKRGMTQYISEV